MIGTIQKRTEFIEAFVIGFLFSLIIFLFKEISGNLINIGLGIIFVLVAIYLAKNTAHHFHGEHTHALDSSFDIVAILILFLVNIFHPAVDGFSFYEISIRQGFLAGIFFALGIVVHEIVRQSVLVTVFKNMGIKWYWVVGTAVTGILTGITIGFFSNNFLENYELWIDMATIFAYSFIVSEFYYSGHFINKKSHLGFFVVGILSGLLISLIS